MHKVLKVILSPITNFFPKGFPVRKLVPLLLLLICESFTNNSIAAYAGFMVTDFGIVDNPSQAGYYSGILNACYFFSQFLSSFFLGVLSDNIGRRPILLIGSLGSLISTLLFGFSFNYWWAVISRSINGLVNGNIGVIKTFMGEFSTKENRAQVFGLIGLTNGLGMIIGASVGGYLARPAKQYPSIFGGMKFFEIFPFILPNLVCSLITMVGVILGYFYLEETKPRERTNDQWYIQILNIFKKVIGRTIKIVKMLFSKEFVGILCCFSYSIISVGAAMLLTVIPLLMMASIEVGGFGWETSQIGTFNMISAVGIICTQLFIYRPTVKLFGPLWTNRIGSLGNLILYNIPPCIYYLYPYGNVALWIGLGAFGIMVNITTQFCFASVMAMIANSVKNDLLGTLNGLSQSLVALFRLFAPLISSPLIAWSFTQKFPFNAHFTFFVLAVIPFINFLLLLLIPKSINYPKQEVQYTKIVELDDIKAKDETTQQKDETTQQNVNSPNQINTTKTSSSEEQAHAIIIDEDENQVEL
ncbi:transporter, major facilitator family protein [Entamoeba histolytica HM-1:IMSS-B]|uniref:Transporter, major facilitator family n=6 Tax=Entamoeba histolytica TaxID=5759 RepID=C4M254_ENTH1|nr:transporter, major facilitator family [Entamoeba histolytica HM-1:IMSS]EMD46010.1 transporter major facilitator family protein, putative [Entamoeba histolytica KU27]EMH77120.1 transporter, major facilitator family protein [Entamoeba histolytica HM-1:IMSS-B]EMS14529.1 transporter, major facilitator family protein [Entamoeba histolytica HM-3:IMSS]ENY65414.1 transporter, major facilitator family protein, putative [Entamoeba histolytica HM-1:IMSS-A]GAT95344.1 transporter major facilitator famil|eukprot:XP_652511.1 transporter, major facilitator family [Entamoeba histolytica HM-1:IMSS]